MKKVSEIALKVVENRDFRKSTNAISNDTLEARPVVLKLLGGLATVYPSIESKLRDDFSADMIEEVWTMALEDYNPNIIMEAFKAIVKGRGAHDRFPPTPVHFGMICKDIQTRGEVPTNSKLEHPEDPVKLQKEMNDKFARFAKYKANNLTNKREAP